MFYIIRVKRCVTGNQEERAEKYTRTVREYVRSRKTLVRPGERRPSHIVSHIAEASSNVLEDGLLGRRGWALTGAPKRRLEDD